MIDFSFDMSARNKADDLIDDLIDKVLAAYPPGRLMRIKARTEAAWKDRDYGGGPFGDRIAYVAYMDYVSNEPPVPDDATAYQSDMIAQLRKMLHNSNIDDEYYPGFTSGCEQVTVPSMFGCGKVHTSGSAKVGAIIKSPSDVYSLPAAEIREGHMCYDMLKSMAYKHKRTGGRIPVYITDMQGPFSCAAQMWGIQDFLCDLHEYPDEVHTLLGSCTRAIVDYYNAMYDAIGENLIPIHCHPVLWIPRDCGVALSDDFFAVVSKDVAEEFSCPYLEEIGRAFGGMTVHTCGGMNHLVKLMNDMKTLKCINFSASETDLRKYAKEHDPKIMLLVHKSRLSMNGLPLLDRENHIRLCRDVQKEYKINVIANASTTNNEPNDDDHTKFLHAASLR